MVVLQAFWSSKNFFLASLEVCSDLMRFKWRRQTKSTDKWQKQITAKDVLIAKTRVIRSLINMGGKYIPLKSQHKAIATAKRRVVTTLLYFKEYFFAIKRSKAISTTWNREVKQRRDVIWSLSLCLGSTESKPIHPKGGKFLLRWTLAEELPPPPNLYLPWRPVLHCALSEGLVLSWPLSWRVCSEGP